MPIARGHSPILFFQLSSVPAKDPDISATADADTLKCWDDSILYLAVATSSVYYSDRVKYLKDADVRHCYAGV